MPQTRVVHSKRGRESKRIKSFFLLSRNFAEDLKTRCEYEKSIDKKREIFIVAMRTFAVVQCGDSKKE
jgi:hypothetical protein